MRVALPGRMPTNPKFEILRSVVQAVAVEMVHMLVRFQRSTKYLLHDNTVLCFRLPVSPHHSVALSIDRSLAALAVLREQRVAMRAPTVVVLDAEASGDYETIAVVD